MYRPSYWEQCGGRVRVCVKVFFEAKWKRKSGRKSGKGDWRGLWWGMGNLSTFDIVRSLWEQLVSWEEQGGRQEGERSQCTGVKMGLVSPHYDWVGALDS